MIEARDLQKSFGAVEAVAGVSFSAADGRITGLLGPNGAGKSTTLRMLYTVLAPDGGSAMIDGHNVVDTPLAVRHRIGVFPHNPGIYPNLTAWENVAYFGRLYGMDDAQIEARIEELAVLLEMQEFLRRRAKGFSQGQRTKVALARSLVHEPQNVLLDEPTNGLDVMTTRSLRKLIHQLRDAGRCVLFSSHIMQEVSALCDEIIIINHGRVVASGSPAALRKDAGSDDLEEVFMRAIGDEHS